MEQNPSTSNTPYLVVGLGNPGPRYATTRHNVGWMVVDELARRHGLRFSTRQAEAEIARGRIESTPVIIAKPQTYMNESGRAVRSLARFYKIPNDQILIIYDDIALPVGTIRIREKGSSAGHNGVKSVLYHMGTEAIPRIRVGVDRPADPRHNQIDWVLGRFTPDEKPIIADTLHRAADAIESIFTTSMERTMNTYNTIPGATDDRPPTTDHRTDTSSPEKAQQPAKNDLSTETLRDRIARIMHKN